MSDAIDYQTPYTGITSRTASTLESADMTFPGVTIDGAGSPLKTDYSDVKEAVQTGVVIGKVLLRDVKADTTAGGAYTTGSAATRDLTEETIDTLNVCSLSSNQFTLAAGTYSLIAIAPSYLIGNHKLSLYNISDSSVTAIGINSPDSTTAMLFYTFTIASSKTFEIQQEGQTSKAVNGLGVPCSFGYSEIYATVAIDVIG